MGSGVKTAVFGGRQGGACPLPESPDLAVVVYLTVWQALIDDTRGSRFFPHGTSGPMASCAVIGPMGPRVVKRAGLRGRFGMPN